MDVCASQLHYISDHLTNVRAIPLEDDLHYQQTESYRIHTMAFASDEYEYIRMTNIDGGESTQVFMSLWYPRDGNLPVFGDGDGGQVVGLPGALTGRHQSILRLGGIELSGMAAAEATNV